MRKKYLAELAAGGSAGWLYASFIAAPLIFPLSAIADSDNHSDNVQFNTSFLDTGYAGGVDLKQFSEGNGMLPGQYLVDVYLNDELVTSERMTFSKQADGQVAACMTSELLAHLNVEPSALQNTQGLNATGCSSIGSIIPHARVMFDSGQQRLNIRLPQEDMQKTARGSVPPALWQTGSVAGFVSYNANAYQTHTNGQAFESRYLSLNAGINLGEWYFRHNGSLSSQTDSGSHYQSLNSYVQHDVSTLGGRFLAGQANTSGRLFDSVSYTGVSLFSDDQMLPESQRGYAPEIRGIARSTARVTVRQSGNVIYETTVPTGAFIINDLYPTGFGGDLDVTVRESDGSESHFLVPYASVADLLRPGSHRYEAVAGRYRSQAGQDGQPFYQATWQQGLTNILSLYGGIQLSTGYQAYQGGGAVSTPVGALALDVTQAQTRTQTQTFSGQSYRVTWNKLISDTQSNIALAAYRFSTRDYLDFSQAMQYQNLERGGVVNSALLYRTKNRYSLTLSQGLGDAWGTLSASGISQNYWNRSGNDMQYQVGYSNRWDRVSYSVTASRSRTQDGVMNTSWLLSFSIPLGGERPMTFSAGLARDVVGNISEQASLSGTAGEEQQMSWGVNGAHDTSGGSTGSVSGQYISPWSTVSGGAGLGRDSQTLSAGLTGSVVAHPAGITFTPYTGDTWVVVHAPGAAGADVTSYPGLKLDHWGNAVMPASMPYQRNTVGLDPKNLADTVELDSTSTSVVPRSGAVVMAKFETRSGYALLLTPARPDAGLPFGASVTDEKGNAQGLVGQAGMIYTRVEDAQGRLFSTHEVNGKPVTCVIPFVFSPSDLTKPMQRMTYTCNTSDTGSR